MNLESLMLYVQQTVNGFAWAFMTAWIIYAFVLYRSVEEEKEEDNAGKRD